MKNCYFWATPSGSINLIEGDKMPVRPKKFDYESGGDPPFTSPYLAPSYYDAMEVYEAALQRAKESSVPIQDQLRARKMCMLFGEIKPDTIYGPFTVEYEIDYRIEERPCNNCGKGNGCCYQCTKVAILLPDKERKDFNPLYKKISDDQWFKKAYEGRSIGDNTPEKEEGQESLLDELAEIVEYVEGGKVAHRFRGMTIPVIEYNELIKRFTITKKQ